MMSKNGCTKLCPFSLGIAFGITEGLFMLLFAWAAWLWTYGAPAINQLASLYYGYGPTFMGGLMGGLWGLVVGFIFGIVVGWIYNLCLRCRCRKTVTPIEIK